MTLPAESHNYALRLEQAGTAAAYAAEFRKIVDSVHGKSVAVAKRVDSFERNVTAKVEDAEMSLENELDRLAGDFRILKWMTGVWAVLSGVIVFRPLVQ